MVTLRPALAGALLLALAVALAAGASLSPAVQGQTPPATFNANGVLTAPAQPIVRASNGFTNSGCVIFGSDAIRLGLWNTPLDNLVGLCGQPSGGYLYLLFPSDVSGTQGSDQGSGATLGWEILNTGGTQLASGSVSFTGAVTLQNTTRTFSGTVYKWAIMPNAQDGTGSKDDLTLGLSVRFRLTVSGDINSFVSDSASDIPDVPDSLTSKRNSDYSEATLSWTLRGPVVEYQVERQEASSVVSGDLARIEYGNTTLSLVAGKIWGLSSYTDATVDSGKTYRYRLRARRGDTWSAWSNYAVSLGLADEEIDPPANVSLSRAHDNSQVAISWTLPAGSDFDNVTIQRQELVSPEGSALFANLLTLSGADCGSTGATWLPATAVACTDAGIMPGRTYEYRVAVVKSGQPGDYSGWVRSAPVSLIIGDAPTNLRLVEDATDRILADLREYWMRWDPVEGADDYEVEVRSYGASGNPSVTSLIYTDPRFFRTAYGRTELRVRGRRVSDALCGNADGTLAAGETCPTDWTPWYGVQFSPRLPAADASTPAPDASIEEFRTKLNQLVDTILDQTGADVSPSVVLQFASLVGTIVICSGSIILGWRRGGPLPVPGPPSGRDSRGLAHRGPGARGAPGRGGPGPSVGGVPVRRRLAVRAALAPLVALAAFLAAGWATAAAQ